MNYEIGSRVGDYEVLQVLGAGGMGRVYKVRNVISDRIEAMKVLLPDLEGDPDLADRFMREVRVQASLDHPNIAALHTALRLDNQLLMLLEFVEGVTIESMLQSGPVPIDRALDYVAQVLSALAYAHGRGVVHRDLKPANMMVMPNGVVKLMDFGIAKMTADRKLTQTGRTVGSLYYMSPEQVKGALDLDPRSDLYSLGVSFYEIVTGKRPFHGDSEYSIMQAHLQENPPPPIQVSPNLPPALSEIILVSLQKDPARRFQTADAFRKAILSISNPAQAAAAPAAPQPHVAQPPISPAPPPLPQAAPAAVQPPPLPPPRVAPAAVQPSPPPPAARQPSAGGHRGLWIALGSLVTIAVLALAVTQIPKFRRTAASGTPAQTTVPPATAPVAVPPAAPEAGAVTPPPVPQPQPTAATAPAPVETAPPPRRQASTVRPSARRSNPVATAPVSPVPAPAAQAQPASAPAQAPVSQPQATPAPDAKAAEAKAAELDRLHEQVMLLGVRAGSVRSTIENLRREQARSGLGLRADMDAAERRMEYQLDEADAAIRRGDAQAAKRSIGAAEREVSTLEKFLGR